MSHNIQRWANTHPYCSTLANTDTQCTSQHWPILAHTSHANTVQCWPTVCWSTLSHNIPRCANMNTLCSVVSPPTQMVNTLHRHCYFAVHKTFVIRDGWCSNWKFFRTATFLLCYYAVHKTWAIRHSLWWNCYFCRIQALTSHFGCCLSVSLIWAVITFLQCRVFKTIHTMFWTLMTATIHWLFPKNPAPNFIKNNVLYWQF